MLVEMNFALFKTRRAKNDYAYVTFDIHLWISKFFVSGSVGNDLRNKSLEFKIAKPPTFN